MSRWKRLFIRQLHVFTREIGFCESFLHVCRLNPKTIVSQAEAAERHRKREEARRRAAGAVDRETYEQSSLTRQKPWEALGMSRASWYRAGKPAAPPLRQVRAYCRTRPPSKHRNQ